jgi:uncharacterized lipoprotein YddW (UPF0748 family)
MGKNTFCQNISVYCLVFFAVLSLIVLPGAASAQNTPEYRAYWAETFNTQMGTRAEIDRLIDSAVQSNANAIFAQVRRRGDSWYLDTKEPLTQVAGVGEPDASGNWTFDPLQYLIEQAHARNIEIHAYIIAGAIYNAHPTATGLPRDPNHVFNQHFWDKTTGAPYTDSRQWSTRSLPHNPDGTTFNGQRYTAEWYVDFGHPEAAAHIVDVLTHLVKKYDVDGLHLDRIRYPEAPIDRVSGKPHGINTGYNETSVQRFKARYGDQAAYYQTSDIGTVANTSPERRITAADVGYPKTNDPLWNDWRREQVTNVVRRIYLNATAVKPQIKVSAALINFYTGPTASGGWEKTEAFYRVFQDWQKWTQEGTLDIIAPMIYKQEHTASVRAQYDDWLTYTKELARTNNRHSLPGLGVYLNGIEGSLRQARRALARPPFDTTNQPAADGVIFYALGSTIPGTLTGNSTSAAVTNNPFSYPVPGVTTPKRTNADFFAALKTGANANMSVRFEDAQLAPLFPTFVPVPEMPWKSQPTEGYIMGFARRADETALDAAEVTITNLDTGVSRTTVTDGGGFYGGLRLAPGKYLVKAVLNGETLYSCAANVEAGKVATANLQPETTAPPTAATLDPTAPNGANGWFTSDVTVNLSASDDCSGISATEYSFDGENWTPYNGSFVISREGATTVSYRSTDRAGNVESVKTVSVQIDKSAPTIDLTASPNKIFPPNGKSVTVTLSGSGADAVSGLASVSYVVTDEYGAVLNIPTRTLSGNSASWTDSLTVEASRRGDDTDGRLYRVTATITDTAGNVSTATTEIVIEHDRGNP